MQPETKMLYKLIILYILDRVDSPVTNSDLAKFVTEKEYTNWFNIQQVLNELDDDNYITSEPNPTQTLHRITDAGKEVLSLFYKTISKEIRDDIDIYLANEKLALREKSSLIADYYKNNSGEYVVELKILERGSSIIELNILVATASAAEAVCNKWKQKNEDIYAYVYNALLGVDKQ